MLYFSHGAIARVGGSFLFHCTHEKHCKSAAREPNESNEEKLPKKEQGKRAATTTKRSCKKIAAEGPKNKRRSRRKSGKSREKGNIQEAQAESEAYKRISIIVDVIIIFHFQSKRYPIIAPQRLPTHLLSFSLSLSLSLVPHAT